MTNERVFEFMIQMGNGLEGSFCAIAETAEKAKEHLIKILDEEFKNVITYRVELIGQCKNTLKSLRGELKDANPGSDKKEL